MWMDYIKLKEKAELDRVWACCETDLPEDQEKEQSLDLKREKLQAGSWHNANRADQDAANVIVAEAL